jgi:hypothetical protein
MKPSHIVGGIALSVALLGGAAAQVVEVDADTVRDLTNSGVPILFAGTVSWCGHCTALKKVWDQVARTKLARAGAFTVARADCGDHAALCEEMGVVGYPTVVFVDGKGRKSKYRGARQVDPLISYVRRMIGPDVHQVRDAAGWSKLTFDDEATFLLASGRDKRVEKVFAEACVSVKAHAVCAMAASPEAEGIARKAVAGVNPSAGAAGSSTPVLTVFKDGRIQPAGRDGALGAGTAGPDLDLGGSAGAGAGSAALEAHMLANRFPLVTDIKPETYSALVNAGRRVAVAAFDPYWKGKAQWLTMLRTLAARDPHAETLYFGALDGIQWHDFTKQYGVGVDDLPRIIVVDAPNRLHWYNASIDATDRATLDAWLGRVASGAEPARGGSMFERFKGWLDDHLPGLTANPMAIVFLLAFPLVAVWYICIAAGGDEEHGVMAAASGRNTDRFEDADGDGGGGDDDDDDDEDDDGHQKRE